MIIRLRYRVLGGHLHCRVFTAKARHLTFAKVGELTFSIEEWPGVRNSLNSTMDILPEDDVNTMPSSDWPTFDKDRDVAAPCICAHYRPHEHPPFGGVRRDPACPVHGDHILRSGK